MSDNLVVVVAILGGFYLISKNSKTQPQTIIVKNGQPKKNLGAKIGGAVFDLVEGFSDLGTKLGGSKGSNSPSPNSGNQPF